MSTERKNTGTNVALLREAAEVKVGLEAVGRVGKCKNLKGVVHEVIVKDMHNMTPKNIINGSKANLTKSVTAVRDDIVVMKNGVRETAMQLKDTPASISKTVNQVKSGHYARTNLMGTKETVKAYNDAVKNAAKSGNTISQKMTSTGVSSKDTARIATKTIGSQAGKLSASAVGKAAASSGTIGAAISGGIEVISSGIQLANGEIDGCEFALNVAKETVGGGLSAAGGTAAATVAAAGVATAVASVGAPIWVPAAVGVGAAVAVGSAIKGVWDFFWQL